MSCSMSNEQKLCKVKKFQIQSMSNAMRCIDQRFAFMNSRFSCLALIINLNHWRTTILYAKKICCRCRYTCCYTCRSHRRTVSCDSRASTSRQLALCIFSGPVASRFCALATPDPPQRDCLLVPSVHSQIMIACLFQHPAA